MSFWRNRRVLLTGHTGFKGAWLSLWLESLGASVTGMALDPPTTPSLFGLLAPWPELSDHRCDIRAQGATADILRGSDAEIVIHMAAQPLVGDARRDPVATYATNTMGTAHLLQAALDLPALQAVLVITTDKVYANSEDGRSFVEDDALGATEPYGGSKAAAEVVVQSFLAAYAGRGIGLGAARAGNVIGGGDWAGNRIVPDAVRALGAGETLVLRNPQAIRPWQHVLEPLAGYLLYAQRLAKHPSASPAALNFGPHERDIRTVQEVVETLTERFGGRPGWCTGGEQIAHEAGILKLTSDLAIRELGWEPRLDFEGAIAWTADWFTAWRAGQDMRAFTLGQIERYGGLG
jgi:CDP-glucose 4,6-dehydratase